MSSFAFPLSECRVAKSSISEIHKKVHLMPNPYKQFVTIPKTNYKKYRNFLLNYIRRDYPSVSFKMSPNRLFSSKEFQKGRMATLRVKGLLQLEPKSSSRLWSIFRPLGVNFINVFRRSFYSRISQKHKKLLKLTVLLRFWDLSA